MPRYLGGIARIAAILLVLAGLLLVGGYFALREAFPAARLAQLLSEHVSETTGRAFRVDGDLSIRFFPALAIEANGISLANAEWGQAADMAKARRVDFQVSARDLLQRRLRIISIHVEGADLALESDEGGHFNWQLGREHKPGAGGGSLAELEHIVVDDARVSYRNGKRGTTTQVVIQSLAVAAADNGNHVAATLMLGTQALKIEGTTGLISALLSDADAWPVDLEFGTEGATASAKGSLGTGPDGSSVQAKVSAHLTSAAALAALGPAAARLPMPVELNATLSFAKKQLQAEALAMSIAGQQLNGSASLQTDASPMRLKAELASPEIDLARWRIGTAKAEPSTGAPGASGARGPLFGDEPLPLPDLPKLDAEVGLKVARLNMPGVPALAALDARIAATPGRLQVDPLNFSALGGDVRARLTIAQPADATPQIEAQATAKSLSVEALDTLHGRAKNFDGGRADVEARLSMRGRTPRALAASAAGEVLLTVSSVALTGKAARADQDIVGRVLETLIPTNASREDLVVQCAVARLPLRNGVASIDRSIAMETRQIAVAASGQVDLAKQTLTLAFLPSAKKGLDLRASNLVDLMLLSGPLADPQLSINPRGAVREAANVAVAAATGGLSLLAPAFRSSLDGVSACAQAVHGVKGGGTGAASSKGPLLKRRPFGLFK